MIFTNASRGAVLWLFLFTISLSGCQNDDPAPITLRYEANTTFTLFYHGDETSGYTFPIAGGDGDYSVQSGNAEIVFAEMISPVDLRLEVIGLGETTVVIMDNSHNELILHVSVDYETEHIRIKALDIAVSGNGLTEVEKEAIREEQLARIPVKSGGGYTFIHTDAGNRKGKAIIYPETFGVDGFETTFELREIEQEGDFSTWGYEIAIQAEKRLFILGQYHPSGRSTRMSVPVTGALMEDVTEKVQMEYPQAESVYTSQVIATRSGL